MNFFGKNTNPNPFIAFYERSKYRLKAYETINSTIMQAVKDFSFSDYALYGKVNSGGMSIFPLNKGLKTFIPHGANENAIMLLDFVGEAFEDLVDYFEKCKVSGKIPNQSFINNIQLLKGYKSPAPDYFEYISLMKDSFHENFIINNKKNILNFDDYIREFIDFVKRMGSNYPVTLSSWYRTKTASPFHSGIYLSILDIPFGDDSKKEVIVNDPTFSFFIHSCKEHGFYVYKNNPSVLVADLKSKYMMDKYSRSLPASIDDFFSLYYMKASHNDMDLLYNELVKGYNEFVDLYPEQRKIIIGKNNHAISVFTKRNMYNNNINYNTFIKLYILIRNIENDYPFHSVEVDDMANSCIYYLKKLDRNRVIDYIDQQFVTHLANRHGSVNWYKQLIHKSKMTGDNNGGY